MRQGSGSKASLVSQLQDYPASKERISDKPIMQTVLFIEEQSRYLAWGMATSKRTRSRERERERERKREELAWLIVSPGAQIERSGETFRLICGTRQPPINDQGFSRLKFPASQADPRRVWLDREFPCHYLTLPYFCIRWGRKEDTYSQGSFCGESLLYRSPRTHRFYTGRPRNYGVRIVILRAIRKGRNEALFSSKSNSKNFSSSKWRWIILDTNELSLNSYFTFMSILVLRKSKINICYNWEINFKVKKNLFRIFSYVELFFDSLFIFSNIRCFQKCWNWRFQTTFVY